MAGAVILFVSNISKAQEEGFVMHLVYEKKLFYLLYVFGLRETLYLKNTGMSIAMQPVPLDYLRNVMVKYKNKGL